MTRRALSEKKRRSGLSIGTYDTGPDVPWPPGQIPWPPDKYWKVFLPRHPSQPWVDPNIVAGPGMRRGDMKAGEVGNIMKLSAFDKDTAVIRLSNAQWVLFASGDLVRIDGTGTSADGAQVVLSAPNETDNTFQCELVVTSTASRGTITKLAMQPASPKHAWVP